MLRVRTLLWWWKWYMLIIKKWTSREEQKVKSHESTSSCGSEHSICEPSPQGLPGWNQGVGRYCDWSEAQSFFPRLLVLAELISLWLYDCGPYFFADCWSRSSLSSQRHPRHLSGGLLYHKFTSSRPGDHLQYLLLLRLTWLHQTLQAKSPLWLTEC